MSTQQEVKMDERTVAVMLAGNTWGLNVMMYGLLLDIMYRSAVLHEAPWDLYALIGLSGVISTVYMARHKALGRGFSWKTAILMAIVAFVAAVVAAILAMTKAMG